jgi:putative phage-type endonuclease
MRLIDIRQRTPEWERWRSEGVTASEAPVVLGLSPYKTPWRLWAERVGLVRPADLSGNPHVARGVALEDAARQACEARLETLLLPVCGESDTHPVLRASFDGLTDAGAPVELKAPSQGTWAEVARAREGSAAYRLYSPQVQHQLYVAGADTGWLAFYFAGELELFEVRRDETLLSELVERALAFWEAVRTRHEPERDPTRDLYVPSGEALAHWTALAADYRALAEVAEGHEQALTGVKQALDEIETALLERMGAFVVGEAAGLKVTRYLQSGAVDYKAALKALVPELAPETLERYRRKSAERVRVTLLAEEKATVPLDSVTGEGESAARHSFFF